MSNFDISMEFVTHLFDEQSIDKNISPDSYCQLMARGKATSLIDDYPNSPILSADTIVVSPENKIFEKPRNKEEALYMLSSLSGNTHRVLTGVNMQYAKKRLKFDFVETTLVEFNDLVEEDIEYYVENYSPYDKSGSYGIQGFSSIFVKSISGCYFNVVGLPLSTLFFHLKKYKLVQFA